jgi:AraC family transcriptional regulator
VRHAFSDTPSQVRHIRSNLRSIESLGFHGIDEKWDVPVALWTSERGFEADYPDDGHATVSVIGRGSAFERRDGRYRGQVGGTEPGAFILYPGNGKRSWASRGPVRFGHLYFQLPFLSEIAMHDGADPGTQFELRDDRVFARDPTFRMLVDAYVSRARSERDPPTALEMDARATLLAIHLVRHHSNRSQFRSKRPAGLDSRTLARALEFLDSSSSRNVSLAEAAAAVGLSTHYFCTAFARMVGVTPHRYHLERRVERAKLLILGDMPIAQIALECGFSSQAHFTTTFREYAGMPPAAWRRANAGMPREGRKILKNKGKRDN